MNPGSGPIRLRPEEASDDGFLLRLYASTREAELQAAPWTNEQKLEFIVSQFLLQRAHYRKYYSEANFDVVLRGEQQAGRLYVLRKPEEIRIVDLAIAPEWRGCGIGTSLLTDLAAEADRGGIPLSLHVEAVGRARRLYERFGFELREEKGPYVFLVRPALVRNRS